MSAAGAPGEGFALPRTPTHQGATAPWTADFESGELGRGIVGASDATGAPCPSPIPPIKSRVPRALSPWWGRSGGGKAPSASALSRLIALLPLLCALAGPAWSAVGRPEDRLPDPAKEALAQEIGRELRCMVCQNQSIEDSDADLARDLRRIVRERIVAGDDAPAVMRFVHARYGDFVLLRPPFNPVTALLWAMPVIALGGGLAVIFLRRRRAQAGIDPVPLSDAERRRLAELERGGGA